MMRMAIFLIAAASCSKVDAGWEEAARKVNGDLAALRPTSLAIEAIANRDDSASVQAVVGMCSSMDHALRRLASTEQMFHRLDRESGGPHAYMTNVPSHADWIADRRIQWCPRDLWRCRDYCVETWRGLADSVDVLRKHAAKHGAHLESLREW
jgi:hypothetical protein